jgi:malate dehydrogenase (quinone)
MMVSNKGYAVNYQLAAEYMINDAVETKKDIRIYYETEVGSIKYENEIFTLQTTRGEIKTRFLLVSAGAYSLKFAKQLGYGLDFTIFPVAGSFITSPYVLFGKVYPMAEGGNPWAVIHGDPDILGPTITRWGPSTKPLPLMERHHYETFKDYMEMGILTWPGIRSSFKVVKDEKLLGYLLKNELYDVPKLGMYLFHKEVQRIVPFMGRHHLKLRRQAGGIRPQLVNMKLGKLIMGDSLIEGVNSLFSTTPSPGASVCMGNAFWHAQLYAKSTGIHFDETRMLSDLNVAPREIKYQAMVSAV